MLRHAKRLFQSRFVRNVAMVATGTAGAQVIAMIFSPIITRLYGPEVFGVSGTFLAILEIIAPFAALSYPIAIVLAKNGADAISLARLSLGLSVFTSLLTASVLISCKDLIVDTFNLQAIAQFLLLLPVAMFLSVCMAVANQFAIREKLFKLRTRVVIAHSLLINLMKSGLGLISPTAIVLISVSSLGYLLNAMMLWLGIRKNHEPRKKGQGIWSLLTEHKDFALFRTPQIIINSIGQSLPILMLSGLFSPASAGFYVLARTILLAPTNLIGQSVGDVFYPKFADVVHAGGSGKSLLIKACTSLALVGAAPYLILIVIGPWVFALVFGSQWRESGEYAQWMSLWLFSVLASRPAVAAIPVLSLQGAFLVFEGVALAARALAISLGYFLTGSPLDAVAAFSLCNVLIYAALTGYVIRKA